MGLQRIIIRWWGAECRPNVKFGIVLLTLSVVTLFLLMEMNPGISFSIRMAFRGYQEDSDSFSKYLHFYNIMGIRGSHVTDVATLLNSLNDSNFAKKIWSEKVDGQLIFRKSLNMSIKASRRASSLSSSSLNRRKNSQRSMLGKNPTKTRINIATVACTSKQIEIEVRSLLKSVVIFSRHVDLNLVIFGDDILMRLAPWILHLKWAANSRGLDFTYELHPVWFPNDEWRQLWGLCTTQRLFFPFLLPNMDSLLYLDTDSIVISDLRNLWKPFDSMKTQQVAALVERAPYPANGWYNKRSKIPYHGRRGIIAGYILMNLTRMRDFDFVNKSVAAYTLHRENIQLADQDILNIVFHQSPQKILVLDCKYNLLPDACGKVNDKNESICQYENKPGPICLCNSTKTEGVHVLHAIRHIFHINGHSFWRFAFESLQRLNMKSHSFRELFKKLIIQFNSLSRPCFHLTGENLYKNVMDYFGFL